MFRMSQNVQMNLNDRMLYINDQTRKAIDSSRAKMVGGIIYPNVDESRFSGLYSSNGSRPNILICRYVSALILKRMYRLSDEVLLEFIRCGSLNFQYALHTTQEETQPLSESSLRRFRRKVEAYNHENSYDLIKDEFERISRKMAVDMGVLHEDVNAGEDDDTVTLVRMDSMEIEAHAKAMTRIEILYTTNLIVIRYLLKKGFKDIRNRSKITCDLSGLNLILTALSSVAGLHSVSVGAKRASTGRTAPRYGSFLRLA